MPDFKALLGERIDRLAQLHKLGAPSYILCLEVAMVYEAALLAEPLEMGRALADRAREANAHSAGRCETAGCDALSIGLLSAGPFHQHCVDHAQQAEAEVALMEAKTPTGEDS